MLTSRPRARHVWFMIGDHYEPLWNHASPEVALERVQSWRKLWPEIAARHRDSDGRPAQYTFFYAEEEYRPELLDPLAEITALGMGDVEVHIHHDCEGEANFVGPDGGFKEVLSARHGLLT